MRGILLLAEKKARESFGGTRRGPDSVGNGMIDPGDERFGSGLLMATRPTEVVTGGADMDRFGPPDSESGWSRDAQILNRN